MKIYGIGVYHLIIGVRAVHCTTCEGTGAALRTFLRPFRGVHNAYLHLDVATLSLIHI